MPRQRSRRDRLVAPWKLRRLSLENFRSFSTLDVELNDLNVVIGANASGKSNFGQAFRFLRNIALYGLENAVSMQGGPEYLTNTRIGFDRDLEVGMRFDPITARHRAAASGKIRALQLRHLDYEFAISWSEKGPAPNITADRTTLHGDVFLERGAGEQSLGQASLVEENRGGKISSKANLPEGVDEADLGLGPEFQLRGMRIAEGSLMMEATVPMVYWAFRMGSHALMRDHAVFDFDPRLPKQAAPITGKSQLEEDGSNLAIVLNTVLQDEDKKRMLLNLLSYLLPFVKDLQVEKQADRSLLFGLKEKYDSQHYLPASLLSDGTVSVVALILALFFEDHSLVVIEEPERNLHPSLMPRLVELLKDASRNRQVIVTTHNPELIKYVGIENLLLISRDEQGFSQITRPADNEHLKVFLENEIGVEELFVQNLLEV